tara:strand:+ start:3240 stop:3719 length:480 start_codon:yes stop_codon:yes gene_type:complete
MSKFVEVVATEITTDRNDREYKRVTLGTIAGTQTYTNPSTGEIHPVLAPSKTVRTIGYKVPYLYDEDDESAVPDYLWNAVPGMVIEGQIVRREVLPYEINGEMRNYHTCFVQGNPNSAEFPTAISAAFERSGRTLVQQAVQVPTEADPVATARGIVASV